MTKDEALKLALEALERSMEAGLTGIKVDEAIAAIHTALEQPEQKPVAWMSDSPTKGNGRQLHWTKAEAWRWSSNITPLYTAPPKQTEPEPVAMRYGWDGHGYQYIDNGSGSDWRERHKDGEPLYAAPPKREWVWLAKEEIVELFEKYHDKPFSLILATQDKIKEKNT